MMFSIEDLLSKVCPPRHCRGRTYKPRLPKGTESYVPPGAVQRGLSDDGTRRSSLCCAERETLFNNARRTVKYLLPGPTSRI